MSILNKENKEEVKKYKEFVDNFSSTSLMQSMNWADVKKGWEREYVYLEEDGKIVMAMSLVIRKIVGSKSMIYAPRGPVGDIYDIQKVKKITKEVDKIAKKYNAFVFRFDPERYYDEKLEEMYVKEGYKVRNRKFGKNELIQPRYNMILNISGKTEEEVFKGYSEKTRYNVRVAKRKGVTVRYSRDVEDLKTFYNLYVVTGIRDKIASRPYDYFERMLNTFDENHMRIYIAEFEGEALSAAIAINYGKKTFYLYGASSNEKRNFMPNYLMQQEMIEWAIETGCDLYDFGGVFILDKSNGLYKFKEGFCRQEGVTEFIGEIDKVYSKFWYFAFTKLVPIYQKVAKSIKKMIKR